MELLSSNCLVCYEWPLVLDFYRKYNEMIITKAGATKEEITIYLLTLFCATDTSWVMFTLGFVYTIICRRGGWVGGLQLTSEKNVLIRKFCELVLC